MIKYAKDLGNVLRTFDTEKFIKFIKKHRDIYEPEVYEAFMKYQDDKRFLLGTMAKMVMNRTDMSEETKEKARKILADMSWSELIF